MGFVESHWLQLLLAFILALVATTAAAIAENIYSGKNVADCAKGGFVQGVVFGIFACGTYAAFEILTETAS